MRTKLLASSMRFLVTKGWLFTLLLSTFISTSYAQFLTFQTPNSSTNWTIGQTYFIEFTNTSSSDIYIDAFEFYHNGDYYQWIGVSDFYAPGTHQIPFTLSFDYGYSTSSNNYLIAWYYDNSWDWYNEYSQTFTITEPANTIAQITNPQSYSNWSYGSFRNINFYAFGVPQVNILASIDGGANWSTIASNFNTNNGYNSYGWTVNLPTMFEGNDYTNSLIRVEDASNTSNGLNSSQFTLSYPTPQINVVNFPLSGFWYYNQQQAYIEWDATGTFPVNIYYSTDNGANWNLAISNYNSNNGYNVAYWNIPANTFNATFPNSLFKVEHTSNSTITGQSAQFTFSNVQAASFSEPVASTIWQLANNESMEVFNQSNNWIYVYYIDVFKGGNYVNGFYIGSYVSPSSLGQFVRFINPSSFTAGNDYQLNLNYYTNDWNNYNELMSDVFTIEEPSNVVASVVSPGNGNYYYHGNTTDIEWYSYDVANVNIEYSTDNGASWNVIATNVSSVNGLNSFDWTILIAGMNVGDWYNAIIKVSDATNATNNAISSTFYIEYPNPYLAYISAPTDGTWWNNGGDYTIEWYSYGIPVVDLEYSTDGASNWTPIVTGLSNIQSGFNTFEWSIGAAQIMGVNPNSYIRINQNGGPQSMTSNQFTLADVADIAFITPNSSTVWTGGTTHTIEIEVTVPMYIQYFELYNADGYITYFSVYNNYGVGTHTFNISIPSWVETRSDYYVYVSYYVSNYSYKASDNFTIEEPSNVITQIYNPNEYSYWYNYTNKWIEWESYDIAQVNIDYSLDNGSTWQTIVTNYSIWSNGYNDYYWELNIPGLTQGQEYNALVRISNANDASVFAVSQQFIIYEPSPEISDVSPYSTGAWWANGENRYIEWYSFLVTAVDIEYSIDGGNSWTPIVTNYTDIENGWNSYYWEIPANEFSAIHNNSYIRVKESAGSLMDISEQLTLANIAELEIVTPNSSTVWFNDNTVTIELVNNTSNNIYLTDIYIYEDGNYINSFYFGQYIAPGTFNYNFYLNSSTYYQSANYTVAVSYANSSWMWTWKVTDEFVILNNGTTDYLLVSDDEVEFYHLSDSEDIQVTSNVNWTATSNETWATVTPASGSNNGTINISVTDNPTTSSRTAQITLTDGTISQVIDVYQEGIPYLTVSSNALTVAPQAGSTVSFDIESNTYWMVESNQPWLSVNNMYGYGDESRTLTATANNTGAVRTATVTITYDPISLLTETITVTQNPLPYLQVSSNTLAVDGTPNSTVDFDITSNVNWTVSSNQTWLTPSVASGSNNSTITLTATANNTGSSRTANVTVTDGTISHVIVVTQTAAPDYLQVSANTLSVAATANSTVDFNILANVNWTLTSTQTWLTPSATSGNGDITITLTAQANPTGAPRSATVTVTDGTLSESITVTQEGGVFAGINEVEGVVSVYPNPTNDFVYVALAGSEERIVTVMDVTGKIVDRIVSSNETVVINLTGYSDGMYMITVSSESVNYTTKVVKK
jgi:hypothetical protein